MMKKLVMSILVVCCTMLIVSCSNDDDDEIVEQQNTNKDHSKCTNSVFVYMPWSGYLGSKQGSLYDNFEKNISDIEKAISSGNGYATTCTLVFLATDADNGRLFEINDDGSERVIRYFESGAMTSTSELRNLLNIVAEEAGTETYSIIIGSHANGWLPAGSTPQNSRSFGGLTAALQTDIDTLANAIMSSEIQKTDYICFDDCYMANIESAYSLRDATDWLIASTSEVMDVGLPYSTIWKYLAAPEVNYMGIINGFGDFYSNYSRPYGALSAIDCTKATDMASLMRELNEDTVLPFGYDNSGLQSLDGYHSHVYFDMKSYLLDLIDGDTIRYAPLLTKLKELVPFKFSTPQLYSAYQGGYTFPVKTFSGIAISDPTINPSAVDAKKKTQWWRATH